MSQPSIHFVNMDCVEFLQENKRSFDLVLTSPPYEAQRSYQGTFDKKGGDWVQWAFQVYEQCLFSCRGLVAWVVQGPVRNFKWSPSPWQLALRLNGNGYHLRRPVIYYRNGIPGSGGPDWFRCDHEYVVCATLNRGKLPWSDNTACGHTPKYSHGGGATYRTKSDKRTKGKEYISPKKANPGDVIRCKGGHLGNKLAHKHPAPFPEDLAERFILSFCPPGGWVLDPFGGSGTVAAVCARTGRNCVSVEICEEYHELSLRRWREQQGVDNAVG